MHKSEQHSIRNLKHWGQAIYIVAMTFESFINDPSLQGFLSLGFWTMVLAMQKVNHWQSLILQLQTAKHDKIFD